MGGVQSYTGYGPTPESTYSALIYNIVADGYDVSSGALAQTPKRLVGTMDSYIVDSTGFANFRRVLNVITTVVHVQLPRIILQDLCR